MTELLRFPGGKKGTVKIPSGVRKIAPYAFYSCVAVSSIDVPSTVTNIGDYAFSYSTNLLSVSVTDNVAFFGTALFSGCTRLASFTLPKSITTIKDSMFSYCESLTGVTIPGSVTTIQDYAFLECESLTSMVIPASVRHVGDWAFLGCSDLTALRFLGSAPTVGDEPFETGVTKIYYLAWAPGWGAFLGGCPAVMMPAIEIVQEMNPVTVAEGGTGVLRIKLASQPLGELTVTTARLGGDVNITVSAGGSLVFSPSTWNTFKTVTLAASEDDGDNENGQASFTCSGIGLTTAFVHANEVDDDCSLLVTSPYGEATVSPSRLFYEMGTEVTVSVEPDRSMHFTEWSGDYAGTANPVALTLTGDTRITANFSPNLPAPLPPRAAGKKSFVARWKWADDAAPEGELSVASDSAFTRLVPGYEARYVVNETDCSVTGLVEGKDYWYRVRRYLQDDSLSAWSPKMKVRTGTAMPAFRHLLSEVPVSKGVTQQFPLASLASGTGALAAPAPGVARRVAAAIPVEERDRVRACDDEPDPSGRDLFGFLSDPGDPGNGKRGHCPARSAYQHRHRRGPGGGAGESDREADLRRPAPGQGPGPGGLAPQPDRLGAEWRGADHRASLRSSARRPADGAAAVS
jgi:hypothetical protein